MVVAVHFEAVAIFGQIFEKWGKVVVLSGQKIEIWFRTEKPMNFGNDI